MWIDARTEIRDRGKKYDRLDRLSLNEDQAQVCGRDRVRMEKELAATIPLPDIDLGSGKIFPISNLAFSLSLSLSLALPLRPGWAGHEELIDRGFELTCKQTIKETSKLNYETRELLFVCRTWRWDEPRFLEPEKSSALNNRAHGEPKLFLNYILIRAFVSAVLITVWF